MILFKALQIPTFTKILRKKNAYYAIVQAQNQQKIIIILSILWKLMSAPMYVDSLPQFDLANIVLHIDFKNNLHFFTFPLQMLNFSVHIHTRSMQKSY